MNSILGHVLCLNLVLVGVAMSFYMVYLQYLCDALWLAPSPNAPQRKCEFVKSARDVHFMQENERNLFIISP